MHSSDTVVTPTWSNSSNPLARGVAQPLQRFLHREIAGGALLLIATIAALIWANIGHSYHDFWETEVDLTIGPWSLLHHGHSLTLHSLVNDALMGIFFFVVGLEIKREWTTGHLVDRRAAIVPMIGAIGGMVVPAVFYLAIAGPSGAANGWGIPMATDIAFALGALSVLGSRVPSSLKVFLLTLAILDDMGAILIIALFYTAELKVDYLFLALIPMAIMFWMNRKGAHRVAPILLLGVVMWFFVLKSGVHATLAGVVTAFFIPLKDRWGKSPLHSIEHGLSPYVLYFIIPVFAFANAGVVLTGMQLSDLFAPLPLGIALGLVLGKQIGVFGVTFAMVKMGLARMPSGANWAQIYGIACLAGIGFTMSLFIGSLSYDDASLMNQVRMGVLSGSIVSGVLGYAALMLASAPKQAGRSPETTPAE